MQRLKKTSLFLSNLRVIKSLIIIFQLSNVNLSLTEFLRTQPLVKHVNCTPLVISTYHIMVIRSLLPGEPPPHPIRIQPFPFIYIIRNIIYSNNVQILSRDLHYTVLLKTRGLVPT